MVRNPMPALSSTELAALEESALRDGPMVPIIKSAGPAQFGQIVDGFNRAEIAKKHKIDWPVTSLPFQTDAEFRIAQITLNLKRRQLSSVQRVELAMALEPLERELAAARQREALKRGSKASAGSGSSGSGSSGSGSSPQTKTSADYDASRSSTRAAEAAGLRRDTFEHAKLVLTKGDAETRALLREGKISIDKAFKITRRELGRDTRSIVRATVNKRIGALPSGKFGIVVAAPPWRTDPGKFERGRIAPSELSALGLTDIFAAATLVALWVPNQWMREAYAVLEAWETRPIAVITWLKDEATHGSVLADRTEHCILATHGRMELEPSRKSNVITGPPARNGRYPAAFYGLIESIAEPKRRISLFNDVAREGWTVWDPEVK